LICGKNFRQAGGTAMGLLGIGHKGKEFIKYSVMVLLVVAVVIGAGNCSWVIKSKTDRVFGDVYGDALEKAFPNTSYKHGSRFEYGSSSITWADPENPNPENFTVLGNKAITYVLLDEVQEKQKVTRKFSDELIEGERLAESPSEVMAIVVLEKFRAEAGSYEYGGKAYRWVYVVRIVDVENWSLYDREYFLGGDPPFWRSSENDGTGTTPSQLEMLRYVNSALDRMSNEKSG
jgi:hypothetical protein